MKKSVIIILLIVVSYVLVAVYGLDYIDTVFNRNIYIDNTAWTYSNGEWKESPDAIKNGLTLNKYGVYKTNTNEYIGKYNLKYSNGEWYIKNGKTYEKYGYALIAYKGNKIKLYNYETEYSIDRTVVNAILKKVNISKYGQLNMAKTIKIDIDNDQDEEIIYMLSNVYSDKEESKLFSIVALYDDGEYSIIKSEINIDDELLNVFAIIDVDGDKNLELIISNEVFSCGNTYSMYGLKDGKYVKLGTE